MYKKARKVMMSVLAAALCVTSIAVSGTMGGFSKAEAKEISSSGQKTTNEFGVPLPGNYYNRKVVGYFPNYAIGLEAHKNFDITQLQWDKLTHVQYAFAVADPKTYQLVPSDPVNDIENKFEDLEFSHKGKKIEMDNSLGYYGQYNLMHTMQKMYPDVTTLISTGGWAASQSLWLVMDSESNMNKFADSAVDFIRKYGFDGIDIDFEYPSETSQSGNPADFDISESRRKGIGDRYTTFIKILREKLTAAANNDGRYYWLTSAVTASSWVLGGQNNSTFLDYLDFVSIMSYDYHGGWNQYVENQANIYADPNDTETKSLALPTLGFDWSMRYYRGEVQSEKILMGIPYYTRGWANVQGGNNGLHGTSKTPATGAENIWHDDDGNGQEMAAGANPLWHVMNLMQEDSNYKRYWDPVGCVPYVWNDVKKTFLTFEDKQSIQERINVVKNNNLGGVLVWVMHGDYDYDEEKKEYTVGDTLTTMLYDQLTKMSAASITSDIDIDQETLDYDVDFSGKYDHPNYYYTISVTNHTGEELKGWKLSFDLPKSAIFGSTYGGGPAEIKDAEDPSFKTVTLSAPAWQTLGDGETMKLEGAIKLNFANVKNYKLNGKSMKSEVEAEIARLRSLGLDVPDAPVTPETPETETTEEATTEETTTEIPSTEEPSTEEPSTEEPSTGEPETEEPSTENPDEDTYDNTKVYNGGDTVVYKGVTYKAKWWTKGTAPDASNVDGPWKVV